MRGDIRATAGIIAGGPSNTPPLVPPEVDLRDFAATPIHRTKLFGSAFHAHATDTEWRAGITLILNSWDQIPAGSLPNNEAQLCRLADLGRDLRTWRKISNGALRGWMMCSDGRLYHDDRWSDAGEAWQQKLKELAKHNSRPVIGDELRSEVYARDGYTCRYCGEMSGPLECDHVIPVSRGGSTTLANLAAACGQCNRSKGAKLLSEWLR